MKTLTFWFNFTLGVIVYALLGSLFTSIPVKDVWYMSFHDGSQYTVVALIYLVINLSIAIGSILEDKKDSLPYREP